MTLAGACTSSDCKAGGLAGRNAEGSIGNGYWDKGTTGQTGGIGTGNGSSINVTGIETADAFNAATYGNFDLTGGWYLVDGQTRPFLRSEHTTTIRNAHQLQLMRLDLSADYALAADIEAGETAGGNAAGLWRLGGTKHGFVPVGSSGAAFTGSLDGQGHVVRGLTIAPEDYAGTNQGLFGVIGAAGRVGNIGLTDAAITGAGNVVGGLAGENGGSITDAYVTGSVQGSSAGGLVGKNTGAITRSYATATVSQPTVGGDRIGGLVGENTSDISLSYATGDVTGRSTVGGLVGKNSGAISLSYATGTVSGSNGTDTGGLVAENAGAIFHSYATGGAVSGNIAVGGLVGQNTGLILQSYTTKAVSGSSTVGGFAGLPISGTISSSYFDTTTARTDAHAGSQARIAGVTGLTTAEFQDTASFMAGAADWDFDTTWAPSSSGYYPVLYPMAPVLRVKELSATSVYGSNAGTVTGVSGQLSPTTYVFGKAGDSLSLTGGTVTVDPAAAVSPTPATTSLAAANATVTSTKGTAYRVFYYGNVAQTVTPAALTVTADDARKTYGDAATLSGFTATGLKNGDRVTGVTLASAGSAATAGVGGYAVTASSAQGNGLSNYIITYAGGTLTVDPAMLTITADPVRKTYGDTATLGGFTASGLKNGDRVTGVALSGTGMAATAGVGGHAIVVSDAVGSGLSNYAITYVDGSLTVTPAALTIAAGSTDKTYGDTAMPTGFTTAGLKNGDRVTGVTLASAGAAATAGVGGYAVTASSAQGSGLSNYAITYADGRLIVTPAALTITADTARKTYGDTATLSGFTASGLKNGDSVSSVSLTSAGAATTAGVGSYGIAASEAVGGRLSNYTVTYVDGALTVTPRPILVTVDTLSRPAGTANPTLTYSVDGRGLVNGDTLSGFLTTAASAASPAGSYSIGRGTLAASPNYSLTFKPGVLTVIAAGETVQPQPPIPENRALSGPVRSEDLTQVLIHAVLPRNLVVVTASQAARLFQGNDAPVLFPSADSQAASGGASADTGVSGETPGNSESQGAARVAATCVGGAVTSSACTAAPHPENTRFGRFLRFSTP